LGKSVHLNRPDKKHMQASACHQLPSPKLTKKIESEESIATYDLVL